MICNSNTFETKTKEGRKLLKKGEDDSAVKSYLQAFETNQDLFSSYPYLDKAISNILQSPTNTHYIDWKAIFQPESSDDLKTVDLLEKITKIGFLGKEGSTIDPLNHFFIHHELKLIYCSIPKNACTLFKEMLVKNSYLKKKYQKEKLSVHDFLGDLRCERKIEELITSFENEAYTKFVILRNPFNRVVSAYLNKVITFNRITPYVKKMLKSVYKSSQVNQKILEERISFEQYVEYLCKTEDFELNVHFRPQHCFMGNIEYDLVGRFESINFILDKLQEKFKLDIERKKTSNCINYQKDRDERNMAFHKMNRKQLLSLTGLPKMEQLYTDKLKSMIEKRYFKDVKMYENSFNIKL